MTSTFDARLKAWHLKVSVGVPTTIGFRIVDDQGDPVTPAALSVFVGGTLTDEDDTTGATEYTAVLVSGNEVSVTIGAQTTRQVLRLKYDGTIKTAGYLTPVRAGRTNDGDEFTLELDGDLVFELTVTGDVISGGTVVTVNAQEPGPDGNVTVTDEQVPVPVDSGFNTLLVDLGSSPVDWVDDGLSVVLYYTQIVKYLIDQHIEASPAHAASAVSAADPDDDGRFASVQEFIDWIVDQLYQAPASNVSFANGGTGLSSTEVQSAITEVVQTNTPAQIAAAVAGLVGIYQPLDGDLTAIAALSTTTYGRALLTVIDAAAGRTALGLGTAATQPSSAFDAAGAAAAAQAASQPLDADLTAIAALTTTAFGRGALVLADAAALRSMAGLVLGTDVYSKAAVDAGFQPLDSDLTAIAALTTTSYGRSLLEAANAAALRTLAGTVIGTDVQAWDADLDAIAALATTSFGRSVLTQANAAALRTLAGLVIGTDVASFSDARLSDTRTPTDDSVTSAKIVNGAILNADINSSAAIALTKLAPLSPNRILGNNTGIGAFMIELTTTQVLAMLGTGTPGSTTFLRGDGVWAISTATGSALGNVSGSTNLDLGAARAFSMTATANVTLTVSNVPASGTHCQVTLFFFQNGTGGWTLTLPSGSVKVGTLGGAASALTMVGLETMDGGTNWRCHLVTGFA